MISVEIENARLKLAVTIPAGAPRQLKMMQ